MSNFTVTLKQLRESGACFDGYNKLVARISGEHLVTANRYATYDQDAPIEIIQILDSNGLGDALWSLRCVSGKEKEIRLFAVWCARQVQHLMKDKRSADALDVAENFANGLASSEELMAALDAARAAARDAARAAAQGAAWAVARDAAGYAAWAAARDAARDAAVANQEKQFRKMLNGELA